MTKDLKELRLDRKKTLREVSEVMGMDPSYLFHIERGTRRLSLLNAAKLASYYNVDLNYIYKLANIEGKESIHYGNTKAGK